MSLNSFCIFFRISIVFIVITLFFEKSIDFNYYIFVTLSGKYSFIVVLYYGNCSLWWSNFIVGRLDWRKYYELYAECRAATYIIIYCTSFSYNYRCWYHLCIGKWKSNFFYYVKFCAFEFLTCCKMIPLNTKKTVAEFWILELYLK